MASVAAIRLRSLAENLLLPADAELVPALLADEAAALGRQRGLLFLPGGRVLEFNPRAPLPAAALLAVPNLQRADWLPLPPRPPLADRLTQILLEKPDTTPEALLEAGGEGIGTEEPRPEESSAPARTLGNVTFGLGKGLAWLGNTLHLKGLARAGAKLMAGAMNLAPRLSEALLGRQEASLRDLLRDFRAGNIERALRRALPLGGNTDRGAAPAQSNRLPRNNIFYSLQDLLSRDSGRPSIWFSRFDAWSELEREYRKQAELALRAGDYRRAAFIYGKLLRDYRSAAAALAQGGLHRDAAILYLARLRDTQAAAREFELAGEIDRALDLYQKGGEHALAGDLLRRAGEDELALDEYRLAAHKLTAAGHGHYQAGELMLTHAQRPDLAQEYYQAGWEGRRRADSPMPCAVRLAQLLGRQQAMEKLLGLVTEAETFLADQGSDNEAAEFFNEIAHLATIPALAPRQEELRDRALLGIACRLRLRADEGRLGDLAAKIFAPAGEWSAALVSDATFAVKTHTRPPQPPSGPALAASVRSLAAQAALTWTTLPARARVVTAVCQAADTGYVFVGFRSGEVFCFRPQRGEILLLADERNPGLSLATDAAGEVLVVLSRKSADQRLLTSYSGHRPVASHTVKISNAWLSGSVEDQSVALCSESEVSIFNATSLLPSYSNFDASNLAIDAALLLPSWEISDLERASSGPTLVALGAGDFIYLGNLQCPRPETCPLGWRTNVCQPGLAKFHKAPNQWELAGVLDRAWVFWLDIELRPGLLPRVATRTIAGTEEVRAVTLIEAGLLVAVTDTAIQWHRHSGAGFTVVATKTHALPRVVACYPHYRGNELIVVCANGTVARVWNLRPYRVL